MKDNTFWRTVFIRLIKSRFFDETFQAAQMGIVNAFYHRMIDVKKALDYAEKSELSAYIFFDSDFSSLTEAQQKELSGKTRDEWLSYEKEMID